MLNDIFMVIYRDKMTLSKKKYRPALRFSKAHGNNYIF